MNKRKSFFSFLSIFSIFCVIQINQGTPLADSPHKETGATSIYLPLTRSVPDTLPPTPTPTTPPPPPPTPPPDATVYYLSPTGNDQKSGKSQAEAWATFEHAWQYLYPGDFLILMDGIYYQSLSPDVRNGEPGKPITIRALNDGKAIIDGQNIRTPVALTSGGSGSYYVIEGIIARNSSGSVFWITKDNNVLRRVSGYNANTDGNEHVYIIQGVNNLIEDCIAAGSGRKMILVFAGIDEEGNHNTIRRCFASYREWDGREWHDEWPWNENFEAYSADYNIFENDIAYGYYANAGFSLLAQGGEDDNVGNQVLGSIAIMGGLDFEENPINWGSIRPQPTENTLIKNQYEPYHRVGFDIGHAGLIGDNLLQDILAWGNASLGLGVWEDPEMVNNRVNRATLFQNGLDFPGLSGIDAFQKDLDRLTVTNSRIDIIEPSSPPMTGEGARLVHRYVDGVLKDGSDGTPAQPLWPWPMEQRIRQEMGISVTNLIAKIIPNQVSPIEDTNRTFLSVTPAIQAFGDVQIGQTASHLIQIKNTGSASLTVDEIQFENGNTDFVLTSGGNCGAPPFTLGPSQSCKIEITFSPQNSQAQTTDLFFLSDNLPPYPSPPAVFLSGIGN